MTKATSPESRTPRGGGRPEQSAQMGAFTWTTVLSACALMAGAIALAGWFTHTRRLADWFDTGIITFPNTALAIVCVSAGLLLRRRNRLPQILAGRGLGITAILIGAVTLLEHISGADLGLDMLLVTTETWGFKAAAAPGRIGIPACISFIFLGAAVNLLHSRTVGRRLVPFCGLAVTAIASLGVVGYAFDADPLFANANLTGIAMPTAVMLLLLGIAVVTSTPDLNPVRTIREKSAAGLLSRRALPFVIAIPILLGWFTIAGRNHNWFDRGTGIALLVLALVAVLCGLLWHCVAAVAEHERRSEAREARFRSYFDLGLVGMVISSPDKGIIEVNDEFCRILGHQREELVRRSWADLTHPDDLPADLAQFDRIVAGNIEGYSLEKRFLRKDGQAVHTNVSVKCVRQADQSIDHFVALVQDISERKRSEDVLNRRTRSLEILNRVGNTLSGELDLDVLVQAVTEAGREISGAETGSFVYLRRGNPQAPATWKPLTKPPPPFDALDVESAFHGGRAVRIADASQTSQKASKPSRGEAHQRNPQVRSLLAVPVISRSGEAIGGLLYGHSKPGVFTEEAEKITIAIAAQAAVAIDNAHLYQKAQQEIAQRRQADEAKARLAAIVEHSDDAIVSKDLNGVIRSWNRSAERLFGYSAEEAVGRHITLIIPENRLAEETTIIERIRSGNPIVHFETVRRHKEGKLLDISLSVSPVRNEEGCIIGISKIARDITERKRTERQQRALYELLAAINRAAALPDILEAAIEATCRSQETERAAIVLSDADGVLRFKASRGLSDEYRRGVEGHSPWGEDDHDPQPICIDDVRQFPLPERLIGLIRQEGIGALAFIPLTYEKRLLGKLMFYYREPHTFTRESMLLAQTVASQVVFAIERQRSGEALEGLVNQRTASLREAIAQMEEFSYTVSHDLRAPLRGMKVYSETLLEDYGAALPPEAGHYLNRITVNAERLDKMILDVLTFSRLGRGEFQLAPVALDKLLRQIVEHYPGMQPPQALIDIEPLPDVLGHEPSLTQALSNLLTNAVKFVPPGVQPKVRIWSERTKGMIRLWIADNGIGIDPKYQWRLFSMFERLHPNLKYEGTGVGLAIVRKAVERMGGRVGMESDGVNGSRFWIEVRALDSIPPAELLTFEPKKPQPASS